MIKSPILRSTPQSLYKRNRIKHTNAVNPLLQNRKSIVKLLSLSNQNGDDDDDGDK